MHPGASVPALPHGSPTLVWWARATSFSTLFLVFAGGMVTSTDSGLAVPDWPLSYGMLMPPMVGGIFYEHGHRMVASFVGLLTLIQTVWIQRVEPRAWVRKLAWLSLAAVIAQGLLGGLTVILLLPTPVSVTHACLAQAFFCLTVILAVVLGERWCAPDPGPRLEGSWTRLPLIAALVVYGQLFLGAVMRHTGAGLAISDFPWMDGGLWPDLARPGVPAHLAHRLGAVMVTLAIVATLAAIRTHRDSGSRLRSLAGGGALLLALQLTLGAYTIWTAKQPHVTSLHVVTGASILGVMVLLALEMQRRRRTGPEA